MKVHVVGDADRGRVVGDASELAAAVRRYIDEGTRALKQELAAMNKLRAAAEMPRLRIIEEKAA